MPQHPVREHHDVWQRRQNAIRMSFFIGCRDKCHNVKDPNPHELQLLPFRVVRSVFFIPRAQRLLPQISRDPVLMGFSQRGAVRTDSCHYPACRGACSTILESNIATPTTWLNNPNFASRDVIIWRLGGIGGCCGARARIRTHTRFRHCSTCRSTKCSTEFRPAAYPRSFSEGLQSRWIHEEIPCIVAYVRMDALSLSLHLPQF